MTMRVRIPQQAMVLSTGKSRIRPATAVAASTMYTNSYPYASSSSSSLPCLSSNNNNNNNKRQQHHRRSRSNHNGGWGCCRWTVLLLCLGLLQIWMALYHLPCHYLEQQPPPPQEEEMLFPRPEYPATTPPSPTMTHTATTSPPPTMTPTIPPSPAPHRPTVEPSPVVWSWHYYSSLSLSEQTLQQQQQQADNTTNTASNDNTTTTNNNKNKRRRNMLLAQATGVDKGYVRMLDITSVVNRAYARKFGYDYVSMMGMVLGGKEPWHATFGKVEVLHQALRMRPRYDGILILDTDAIMVDFEVDIADLVEDQYALVAQYVHPGEHEWNLNVGVSLWNLHHPMTAWLSERWRNLSLETLQSDTPDDDQWLLQLTLRDDINETVRNATISTVNRIFDYRYGTVVKHFIRITGQWNETLQDRQTELQEVAQRICQQFQPHCQGIPSRISQEEEKEATTTTTS